MSSSLHGKTPAFQILAHRGLITEDSPHENTIAAFQAALAAGADIIETDVRATSDGIALVFHDADLSRFTGQKTRIGRQPFSILKSHLGAVGVQLHSLEEVLLGPSHTSDGSMNLFGVLRRSMATTGYSDLKEFQRVEVVIQP